MSRLEQNALKIGIMIGVVIGSVVTMGYVKLFLKLGWVE